MATLYVSSIEPVHTSTGNAGSLADPMGVQEAFNAAVAGDEIRIMADGDYTPTQPILPASNGDATGPISIYGTDASGNITGTDYPLFIINLVGNTGTFDHNNSLFGSFFHYYHIRFDCLTASRRHPFRSLRQCRVTNCHAVIRTSDNFTYFHNGPPWNTVFRNCSFVNEGVGIRGGHFFYLGNAASVACIDCWATRCKRFEFNSGSIASGNNYIRCAAIDCEFDGWYTSSGFSGTNTYQDCLALNCLQSGFASDGAATSYMQYAGCIAIGNGGSGFRLGIGGDPQRAELQNCVSVLNGAYGYLHDSPSLARGIHFQNCMARSNTSGIVSGAYSGELPTTLAADPFVDAAGGNFLLADNASAQVLKDASAIRQPYGSTLYPFRSLVGTLAGGGSPITIAHFG